MTDTGQVMEVARGIGDFGMMAVSAAFFIVLAAVMMVTMFRWFKSIINGMVERQQHGMEEVLRGVRDGVEAMRRVLERMEPETQLRVRALTDMAFDLAVEQVCRLVKRVRKENHISDHAATAVKIRKSVRAIHDDHNSRFDTFTYRGKAISEYCNPEWTEDVAKIVESEIYHEDGKNNARAYTNVKLAYDNIKTDFYQRLND